MTTNQIYLAASYARKDEMKERRLALNSMGYDVTSRWIDQEGQHAKGDLPPDRYQSTPDECYEFAIRDVDDILKSDVFVMFTGDGLGSGGRHTELGIALGCCAISLIIIIGPRENVFQCSPRFAQFDTWDDFAKEVWKGQSIHASYDHIRHMIYGAMVPSVNVPGIMVTEDDGHIRVLLIHEEINEEDKSNGSQ